MQHVWGHLSVALAGGTLKSIQVGNKESQSRYIRYSKIWFREVTAGWVQTKG